MKPNSKDRLKVSLISIVFLLALSAIGYMVCSLILGNLKKSGMYTPMTYIVEADNVQQIEHYKVNSQYYAIKVQENDKFYLKYNSRSSETKLDLTSEQFNKLVEDKVYYLKISLSKAGDEANGILQEIFTEDPLRN